MTLHASAYYVVTWKSLDGYIQELVFGPDIKVLVKGGFYSELTLCDGDVVQLRRLDSWSGEIFADKIELIYDFIGE